MAEELYDMRNALALGNFNQVINEGSGFSATGKNSEALVRERDFLVAKAQVGLKRYQLAISDLSSSSFSAHKALVFLAKYLKADSTQKADEATKKECVDGMKGLVERTLSDEGEATERSCLMAITAATVMIYEDDYTTAHKWLVTWSTSLHKATASESVNSLLLEVHSLLVDMYLRISRTELAELELKAMCKIDEDAVLTMLWQAWTYLKKGTPKDLTEALKLFKTDLSYKFGNTPLLLNGVALCHMAKQEYDQAFKSLEEAQLLREDDKDTLINMMICQSQLRPGAENKHHLEMVKEAHGHPWVRRYARLEQSFDDSMAMVK
ncbi:Coatomer subunit epsilon-1 [Diplonema papillatum]|nr:Coatomer subunit epsilon-1 [Diplonema papillatum]